MMTIRQFFDWAEKEGFADFVLSVYANQGESSYASEMNVDKDREEVALCQNILYQLPLLW